MTGPYWHEWQTGAGVEGLQYRVLVSHTAHGLRLRFTLVNGSREPYRRLAVTARMEPERAATALVLSWDSSDGAALEQSERMATFTLAELPAGETQTIRGTVVRRAAGEEQSI